MKSLKHYGPLLWMGFNYLKVTERLRGSSLLVATQSPGFPGTHLIIFGRMKGWNNLDLVATQQIWIRDPGLEIQRFNH